MSHADGHPILLQHAYTEAEWAADNPVLMDRETGWTTDTRRVKLGDGVTAWNDLPWASDGPGMAASAVVETGGVVSFTNTPVYDTGAIIVVPPSDADMWIEWQALLGLTTGADGSVLTVVYELTSGAAFREAFATRCRTTDTAAQVWATHHGTYNAGPSDVWRVFALYGQTLRDGGGAYPVAYFHNNFFGYGRAWISGGTR